MKKQLIMTLGLAMLYVVTAMGGEAASEETGLTKDVVVLYTSGVHCGVDQGFGYVGLQQVRAAGGRRQLHPAGG